MGSCSQFIEDALSNRINRVILAMLAACLVIASMPARSADGLSVNAAINPQGVLSAAISADGKYVAAVGYTGSRYGLILVDTATWKPRPVVVGQRVTEGFWNFDKEPRAVTWVGNDLLAVDYGIEAESIDLNGKKVADVGQAVIGKAEPDRPDSPMVLVFTDAEDKDIALVNARTGERKKFRYPMSGKPIGWAFDVRGELRAVTLLDSRFWKDSAKVSNWYRAKGESEWQLLAEFKITDNFWMPVGVRDQDDALVVLSNAGRDTRAVYKYDTKKRELAELLVGHRTQDILHATGLNSDQFKSVVTAGMKPERYWFDATWAKVQATVDAALPGRINVLSGDPAAKVLVFTYADVDPGRWYVLDMATQTLRFFAAVRPQIDPARMRPMEVMTYPAKDGLAIPAYLTRPTGAQGPAPTVVMIHGGPTVRDEWRWNADTQLLAANGYVVFQPQFRGSSGFGQKFEEAGFGQWGLAMQDDITAGVEQLIQLGIADPNRICIYGASYGGYAALWGLAKTPELYRCGVSFAGVTDIEYMFNDWSDRNSSKAVRELMLARIGDIKTSKEQFDAVSPLKHADGIRAPVLLMHGDDDKRVPIAHSMKMMQALDEHRKIYEWVKFAEEGHGLRFIRNEKTYYEKLLAFLGKYIGPAKADTPKAGENSWLAPPSAATPSPVDRSALQ